VKGTDITINKEVWLSVTGLRNDGAIVSRGNTTELETLTKLVLQIMLEKARVCLKNVQCRRTCCYTENPDVYCDLAADTP